MICRVRRRRDQEQMNIYYAREIKSCSTIAGKSQNLIRDYGMPSYEFRGKRACPAIDAVPNSSIRERASVARLCLLGNITRAKMGIRAVLWASVRVSCHDISPKLSRAYLFIPDRIAPSSKVQGPHAIKSPWRLTSQISPYTPAILELCKECCIGISF
jgi:hypothetical protein